MKEKAGILKLLVILCFFLLEVNTHSDTHSHSKSKSRSDSAEKDSDSSCPAQSRFQCMTCNKGNSEEECRLDGEWKDCNMADPFCETEKQYTDGKEVKYISHCKQREACLAHTAGSVNEEVCEGLESSLTCYTCYNNTGAHSRCMPECAANPSPQGRVSCPESFPGIKEKDCLAQDCCWDKSHEDVPQCFINAAIDECVSNECVHGACVDGVGEYTCDCQPGFDGIHCEIDIDECASNPCVNGACVDAVNGYACDCQPGFNGTHCAINIDECVSNECVHGSCVDGVNEYTCDCQPGFDGTLCEIDIDECVSNECVHGSCVDGVNTYTCDCKLGFTGLHCDINVDECGSNPCMHGACVDGVNGYICECQHGYTGTHCKINVDECASNPCAHGACVDGVNGYTCDCQQGFTGTHCEINVDECASNPCAHGACVDGVNGYTCDCQPGFTGTHCEINVDECASNPCENGSCDDGVNGYMCDCQPGYTGTHCEINIDECVSNECVHGLCVDGVNEYTCDCQLGFTGSHCDINIDECSSAPCIHGACVDGVNGYTCDCQPGYTGTHCGINVDECASNPCIHGSCIDEVNGYSCVCQPGFEGTHCEINIDECASNPCVYGSCVDGVNGYTCVCQPGYTGTHCETNIDECASNPCENGACVDGINGYTCDCQPGYTGIHCEINVDECSSNPCFHGSCDDGINEYACDCQNGFIGTHCEIKLQLKATCNQHLTVYIDGKMQIATNAANWSLIDVFDLSSDTRIIGLECIDEGGFRGIMAEVTDGRVSDTSWMCSNTFSKGWNLPNFVLGPTWVHATSFDKNEDWINRDRKVTNMNPKSHWIWSSGPSGDDNPDLMSFCRYVRNSDTLDENGCPISAPERGRRNCAGSFAGITEAQCYELSSHCCWNNSYAPWCFEKPSAKQRCVPNPSPNGRIVCPGSFGGMTLDDCLSLPYGCCWDESYQGIPWCYLKSDCLLPSAPEAYRGTRDMSASGYTCQRWDSQEPHEHSNDIEQMLPDANFSFNENFCRSTGDGMDLQPWCYTTDPHTRWEYCDLPLCVESNECQNSCTERQVPDRCSMSSNPCVRGECENIGENYFCRSCQAGYDGVNCHIDVDECGSNPCMHGACVDGVNGYTCDCQPGYTGTHCEVDINECSSSPCVHGSCEDLINMFTCHCEAGYTGVLCEIDIDECSSSPCVHGGTCTDQVNGYVCGCVAGYVGVHCQVDVDECASNPCVHGACVDKVNMYTCDCQPGYTGTHCEININECSSNPCVHGSCADGVNRYTCSCQSGYKGTHCEINMNECSSNPCVHGSCIDGVNRYSCSCQAGYTGTRCHININECSSSPCYNSGTCIDKVNGYSCSCRSGYGGTRCQTGCQAGYTGSSCQIDIDECSSAPCTHGGTCLNQIDCYSCSCVSGYKGMNCQLDCIGAQADVAILMDESGSVRSADFEKEKDFAWKLVERLQINDGSVRPGVMTFASSPSIQIHVGALRTFSQVKNKVLSISQTTGGTSTHSAIDLVRTRMLAPSYVRSGAGKFCVLITDGQSNSPSSTAASAQAAKNAGITFFAIGVGSGANVNELKAIASRSDYVYHVDTFDDLEEIADTITEGTCNKNG